jgi:hypothetical protein
MHALKDPQAECSISLADAGLRPPRMDPSDLLMQASSQRCALEVFRCPRFGLKRRLTSAPDCRDCALDWLQLLRL